MNLPAIAAHLSGQHAAACRRRRAAADWTHTGTHYLSSDGASGSYADAATSAAARVVFGGTGAPVFTVAMWVRVTTGGFLLDVSDDGTPRAKISLFMDPDPASAETTVTVLNAAGGDAEGVPYTDLSTWCHLAMVATGSDLLLYEAGTEQLGGGAGLTLPATPYATVDALTLFADYAHANRLAGDIRDFAIWDRALSGAEVAALHTAGVGHDLRDTVGAYMGGGPEHWYPADGDSGTTVTDRGSAGDCDLTLHGGVTIEEA